MSRKDGKAEFLGGEHHCGLTWSGTHHRETTYAVLGKEWELQGEFHAIRMEWAKAPTLRVGVS